MEEFHFRQSFDSHYSFNNLVMKEYYLPKLRKFRVLSVVCMTDRLLDLLIQQNIIRELRILASFRDPGYNHIYSNYASLRCIKVLVGDRHDMALYLVCLSEMRCLTNY